MRLVLVAVALLALGAWAWLAVEAGRDMPAAASAAAAAASATRAAHTITAASAPATAPVPTPALHAPARSLAGTDVDGGWSRDGRGHFVADAEAIRRFDYFLSASGEEDAAAIAGHVRASAERQLSPVDAAAVLALYDRYLDYRAALHDSFAGAAPSRDAMAALALIEHTQRELFGADAAARLFGADDALAEVAIERRDLWARSDLADDERAARLALLEERLPAPMRAARAAQKTVQAAVARALADR
jgi:lipase chaperone LimK